MILQNVQNLHWNSNNGQFHNSNEVSKDQTKEKFYKDVRKTFQQLFREFHSIKRCAFD